MTISPGLLHMGYVDEVLFGVEVVDRVRALARVLAGIHGEPRELIW